MAKPEQLIDKVHFAGGTAIDDEYIGTRFTHCDFANADLSGRVFEDCIFEDCNLSLTKLRKTAFRNVQFHRCKMLGMPFNECNEFALAVGFDDCVLDHSSFYKLRLKKTRFSKCRLVETDMTETDFSDAVFDNCELSGAVFDHTIFERADLRTAVGYSIDPENNKIKGAKFSVHGAGGLLDKYQVIIEA